MEIRKFNNNSNYADGLEGEGVGEIASVLLNVKRKKVKVSRSKVKQVASGLAEIAYSLGETSDEEDYAGEVEDDLFEALKRIEKGF